MNGIELIAQERHRQIDIEGWTPEHDDEHGMAELGLAALSYVSVAASQVRMKGMCVKERLPTYWPWKGFWKPSPDPVRNLVKAGALIAAEIDRIQRSKEPKGDCPNCKHAWKYHVPYGEYPNGCQIVVEQDGERCHCPCRPE